MTPEGKIKKQIREYLITKKWFIYPNTANQFSMKGVPDYTAISPDGLVVQIEVKADKGKQTPEQIEFQRRWIECNGVYVLVHSLSELMEAV